MLHSFTVKGNAVKSMLSGDTKRRGGKVRGLNVVPTGSLVENEKP